MQKNYGCPVDVLLIVCDASVGKCCPLCSHSPPIRIDVTLSEVSSCIWLDGVFMSQ